MQENKLIKQQLQVPQVFSITEEAEEKRNALVIRAQSVKTVTDANSQIVASNCGREIRTWLKQVEAMRQDLTKPFLEAQRLLKALAEDHCGPLDQELKRLERLATDFQAQETRRVEEEKRKAQLELDRLNQIRLAAEKKARDEAERVRLENEVAAQRAKEAEASIETPEQLEAAILANELQAENEAIMAATLEAEKEAAELAMQAVQAQLRQPIPEAVKARGQSVRRHLRHEVLNIDEIYRSRPELSEIKIKPSAVNATCDPGHPVPGLRLWYENNSTFSTR